MSPIRLLLVDDEERFLSTTKVLLERAGMSVLIASNGQDALTLVDEHPIDVVILDVKMPGMNGIDVLREIKRKAPRIEVILLTGHASVDSAVEGLKLGAYDYLMKPCSVAELTSRAQEAFNKTKT